MMYINLTALKLPDGWLTRAKKAHDALVASAPDARRDLIDQNRDLWVELKPLLSGLSHKKCWYCETPQIRSNNAVDHFRPKNKVHKEPLHPGYWWLAFDWSNYRFSCDFCNSPHVDNIDSITRGKGIHFPIFDGKKRAFDQSIDIAQEEPVLLDPTNKDDPKLLFFGPEGLAQPPCSEEQDATCYRRVTTSVDVYNLNHVDIVEARLGRHKEVGDLIKLASDYWARDEQGDEYAFNDFLRVADEIVEKTSTKAMFSAVAYCALAQYRDVDWVKEFVSPSE
jgi:uncharacterized protein (TIGR02646 family)